MSIFLQNKYTTIYFKIIEKAKQRQLIKVKGDNYQNHHIVPRCLGGTDDISNIIALTYKEHRVCHCLLIRMVDDTKASIKLRHAYGFFNKNSVFNGPRYKKGKENVFARPDVVEMVKTRMKENNPMKDPFIQAKRLESWKKNRAAKDFIPVRILKDKFITPKGIFKTKKEIIKVLRIPEWTLNTIYNNLDSLPVSNGRASKKISHLAIDFRKTWRENGFDIINKDLKKNSFEV